MNLIDNHLMDACFVAVYEAAKELAAHNLNKLDDINDSILYMVKILDATKNNHASDERKFIESVSL